MASSASPSFVRFSTCTEDESSDALAASKTVSCCLLIAQRSRPSWLGALCPTSTTTGCVTLQPEGSYLTLLLRPLHLKQQRLTTGTQGATSHHYQHCPSRHRSAESAEHLSVEYPSVIRSMRALKMLPRVPFLRDLFHTQLQLTALPLTPTLSATRTCSSPRADVLHWAAARQRVRLLACRPTQGCWCQHHHSLRLMLNTPFIPPHNFISLSRRRTWSIGLSSSHHTASDSSNSSTFTSCGCCCPITSRVCSSATTRVVLANEPEHWAAVPPKQLNGLHHVVRTSSTSSWVDA